MQQVSTPHRVLRSDIDKSGSDAKKTGRTKVMPRKVKHTTSKKKENEPANGTEVIKNKTQVKPAEVEEKNSTCNICSKVIGSNTSLEKHLQAHHGNGKSLQCTMCDLSFTTNATMLRHMRTHKRPETDSEDSEGSSEGASAVGPTRTRKRRLEYNNNDKDVNGIIDTDETFIKRKPKTINNNTIDEKDDRNLVCPVCETKDFVSINVLENHMDAEHPDYQVKCVTCNLGFKNHRALNLHRFMVHNTEQEKPNENKPSIGSVSGFNDCTFIDFSSQKFPQIAKEVCEKSLHKSITDQKFMCTVCIREFPCESALEIHKMSCNSQENLSENEERTTKRRRQSSCTDEEIKREDFFANLDLQNKSPNTSSPIPRHIPQEDKKPRLYHDFYPKDLIRPIIDSSKDLADIQSILSVTSTGGLLEQLTKKSHESLNTSNSSDHGSGKEEHEESQDLFAAEFRKMKLRGEFPCRLCSAIFPNLRALKGHNRVHLSGNGPGPYRCNMCPHSSMDKAALVRHMRTHNGDRPYECAVCNYAFTTKANCERHLRNRHAKVTREEVKRAIIYHPSEDPNNDEVNSKLLSRDDVKRSLIFNSSNESDHPDDIERQHIEKTTPLSHFRDPVVAFKEHNLSIPIPRDLSIVIPQPRDLMRPHCSVDPVITTPPLSDEIHPRLKVKGFGQLTQIPEFTDAGLDKQREIEIEEEDVVEDSIPHKALNYSSEMPIDLSTTECQDDALDLSKKSSDKAHDNIDLEREESHIPKSVEFNNNYSAANVLEKTQQFLLAQQHLLKGMQMPKLDPATGFYANQLSQLYRSGAAFPLGLPPPFPINPYFLQHHPFLNQAANPQNISEMKERLQNEIIRGLQMSGGGLVGMDPSHLMNNMTLASERLQAFHQQVINNMPNSEQKPLHLPVQIKNEDDRKTPLHVVIDQPTTIPYANSVLSSPKTQKKEAVPSSSPNSVKMVIKNGVLMPKQKQRRYRTERPFSCEHCSARFTLRSNMERHIKQQHPQYWSQRQRSNIGNIPRKTPISMVPQNITVPTLNFENRLNYIKTMQDPTSPGNDDKEQIAPLNKTYSMISDQVKYAILAQQLKAQNIHSIPASKNQQMNGDNEEEDEDDALVIDEESEDDKEQISKELKNNFQPEPNIIAKKVAQEILIGVSSQKNQDDMAKDYERKIAGSLISKNPQILSSQTTLIPTVVSQIENKNELSKQDGKTEEGDLVSVSRLLDNATSQMPFGKYFKNDMNSNADGHRDDIVPCHGEGSEEDEEGLVASGSTSEGNNSGSDENRSESENTQQPQKKKSAYSLAPNRVSCPYCHRKFPWSSSLRRHVLTHTGQKPYKCAHCPLLFTTKSNCDRHLLRKHGNQMNQSQSSTIHDLPPNSIPIPGLGNQGFMMRNVPERPYKCASCPSSTFSTLCNLKKHMRSKHGIVINESLPNSPKNDEGVSMTPENKENDQHLTSDDENSYKIIETSENESGISKNETKTSSELSGTKSDWESQIHSSKCSPYHNESLTISQNSDLPFKCHLCEGSYSERQDALDHIKHSHTSEFELLMSKGALETNPVVEDQGSSGHKSETGEEQGGDESIEQLRGKFPDYANRKVVCAFCVRRFWSAEDLRRHMRTHTGERPYSCDICKRRFTLKHSMLRHRKKHNQDAVASNEDLSIISGDEDTPAKSPIHSAYISISGTSTPVMPKMTLNGYQMAIKNKQLSVSPEIPSNVNNNNSPPVHGYEAKMRLNKSVRSYSSDENDCQDNEIESGTDLIGNLLGISDKGMINKLLSSADEAAKLLGVNK